MKPKKTRFQIVSISIYQEVDQTPDVSYIGKCNDDESELRNIIRFGKHRGKTIGELKEGDELPKKCREYRFFLPAMTGEETGNPDSPKQDFERMESFNAYKWHLLGIRAKAVIMNPATSVIQTISSPGIYGVESDSGDEYINYINNEEIENLCIELRGLNFSRRQISRALRKKVILKFN